MGVCVILGWERGYEGWLRRAVGVETSSVVKWKVLREGRGIGVWISACCHKDPEVTRGILNSVRYYFRSAELAESAEVFQDR